jgi:hypothetical protein
MILWKVGAAAADDFIIAGLVYVTSTPYCGFSAGATPERETIRSPV